uniref:DNA or RNA helicases of superfamily II n=1 Tax=uncultured marine group II/III euryarchaeote AD1000_88_G11 TaxID=1457822 RepID=A0A075G5D4_9EURY|nr:DNA or RNA helicases of superfamily II [uncultured marine group II/III euryarchaeote AD1000_88_G11]
MGETAKYLGQKGYTIFKDNLDIEEQLLIRKELMVKPWVPKTSPCKPDPFPVFRESKKKIYVPRFYGFENYGKADEVRIPEGDTINLQFVGKLRPHQKEAANMFLKEGCGLLELFCGFGKTVVALNIISKIKKKTLIIVHKTFLLNQWKERIQQFLPGARVGTIQGETIDIEDKDIVIGMLQSISMKNYPYSIFQQFGLTTLDECHHLSAEVFSRALFKIVTKHMLGLSATMKRKDGLTHVFKMFIGRVVYSKERENANVIIRALKYECQDEEYSKNELNYRGQIAYATMMKKLCSFNRRSEFILKILKDLLKERSQIMILAHNKSLLKYLYDAIIYRNMESVGYYVGGMKEIDLKISESKKIILATFAMAAEGLDIKTLTTLILATPKTDVTQSIGRILRSQTVEALVVDIIDQHPVFMRQWAKRKAFYKKRNYSILMANMENYYDQKWKVLHEKKTKQLPINVCLT